MGKTKRGKCTLITAMANHAGLPISVFEESATPHEIILRSTLESRFTTTKPEKPIGDKAYESDGLDERLRNQGIELITPNKVNRVKPKSQERRPFRRYKRRWKVERLFAWLGNFRHLVVRYEYHAANLFGFIKLACTLILFRHYLRDGF